MTVLKFRLLVIFFSSFYFANAQLEVDCINGNDEPPGCFSCLFSHNSGNYGATPNIQPADFCWTVENNVWFTFWAAADEIKIPVGCQNCILEKGLEFFVTDTFFNKVSDCIFIQNGEHGEISASGLQTGEPYYLMADGKDGDECNFSFGNFLSSTGIFRRQFGNLGYYITKSNSAYSSMVPFDTVNFRLKNIPGLTTARWEVFGPGEILEGQGTTVIRTIWRDYGAARIRVFFEHPCFPEGFFDIAYPILEPIITPNFCGNANDLPPGCLLCGPVYSGSNHGYTPDPFVIDGFCGEIENSAWHGFVAGGTSTVISITSFNCEDGKGLQMMVLDKNLKPVSNCIGEKAGVKAGHIEVNGIVPGDFYNILVDGFEGDHCEYVIQVVRGISSSPPDIYEIFDDYKQEKICRGDEICYSTGVGREVYAYGWSVPSFGTIISGQGTGEICVRWDSLGQDSLFVSFRGVCFSSGLLTKYIDVVPAFSLDAEIESAGIWFPGNAEGRIQLTASNNSNPVEFKWDDGKNVSLIENLKPGQYCVTATETDGCSVLKCFTVPGSVYKIAPFHILCSGDSKQLDISPNSGATFHWQPAAGLSCTDCPNPVASPRMTTTYTVTATLPNGYSEDYNVAVVVLPPSICDFAQSKEFDTKEETEAFLRPYNLEIESKNRDIADVFLFPNPGNGTLNLKTNRVILSVAIFNHLGDLVSETEPFSDTAVVDFGNAKGVFYLKILTTDGTVYKRAIIH